MAKATDHANRQALGVHHDDSMQTVGFARAAQVFERFAGSVRAGRGHSDPMFACCARDRRRHGSITSHPSRLRVVKSRSRVVKGRSRAIRVDYASPKVDHASSKADHKSFESITRRRQSRSHVVKGRSRVVTGSIASRDHSRNLCSKLSIMDGSRCSGASTKRRRFTASAPQKRPTVMSRSRSGRSQSGRTIFEPVSSSSS